MNTLFIDKKGNNIYNCLDKNILKELLSQYIKIIDFDYKMGTIIIQFTENKNDKIENKIFGYNVGIGFAIDNVNVFNLLVYVNGSHLFDIALLANEFESDYNSCNEYIIDSSNSNFDIFLGMGILDVALFPNMQGAINYIIAQYKIFELEGNK